MYVICVDWNVNVFDGVGEVMFWSIIFLSFLTYSIKFGVTGENLIW